MKASELVKALETEMKLNGYLEVRIAASEEPTEDLDTSRLVGIATRFDDDKKASYFMVCDDSAFDTIHVGGDTTEAHV